MNRGNESELALYFSHFSTGKVIGAEPGSPIGALKIEASHWFSPVLLKIEATQ